LGRQIHRRRTRLEAQIDLRIEASPLLPPLAQF
jgi:hypothetical protein